MEVYNVGADCLDVDEGCEKFVWLVYDYTSDWYEGNGEAVALGKDGLLYFWNLSHCSCYGPLDEFPNSDSKQTIEQFLRDGESALDDCGDAVRQKVESLLRE